MNFSRYQAQVGATLDPSRRSVALDTGPYTFTAEFYCEHRRMRAEILSSALRLSDYLNSTAAAVDVRPYYADHADRTRPVDLSRTRAQITKSCILFVVPIIEPRRESSGNRAWKPTVQQQCWAGIGPYRLSATLHTESGRDPHIALAQLAKQFVPLTNVSLTCPDGSSAHYSTVIVNRAHLDVLAVKE